MNPLIAQGYKHRDAGEPIKAEKIACDILNDDPDNIEAMFLYGMANLSFERYGVACNVFSRCMTLDPQSWEAMSNYALSLMCVNQYDKAEQILHKVLKMKPDFLPALNNIGLIHVNKVNPKLAIEYCERSLKINPNQAEAKENIGYANLMMGNFKEGWSGYEAMIDTSKYRKHKPLGNEPYWKGQKGGRLYVKGEQGIGDEISFASILEEASKDNDIIFDCGAGLEGLFKRSFPNIEVHGTRTTPDKPWRDWRTIDYGCLIGTLAHHYRNEESSFSGYAFLKSDPERSMQWKALLDSMPGRKVGIAWTGGMKNTFTHRRSMSLEDMLPILKTPSITWVSLQYKDPTAEIRQFTRKHGIKIHHWKRASESPDYDDVAALVGSLDAVVSVTTAVVHLCGGLGVKCFTLVPSKPRWFYQISGNRVPWYESVRLYRQTDKWPYDRVAEDLRDFLSIEQQKAA